MTVLSTAHRRSLLRLGIDVLIWTAVVPVALLLRVEGVTSRFWDVPLLQYMAFGIPIKVIALVLFDQHRRIWSAVGLEDLRALGRAVGIALLVLFAMNWMVGWQPRSVPLLEALLALSALGAFRGARRIMRAETHRDQATRRVLVVGTGVAATSLVRSMLREPEMGLLPVGYLDDDPQYVRHRLVGLPVLGAVSSLGVVAAQYRADEIILALPLAEGNLIRQAVQAAQSAGVRIRTVPSIRELQPEAVHPNHLREISVDDLLRRRLVEHDPKPIAAYVQTRSVLVTGGGGSIGFELARQVASFKPATLVLLEKDENSLFDAHRRLRDLWPGCSIVPVLADLKDRAKVRHVLDTYKPEIVLHAAAHKHVPLMEQNPDEAVLNNIGGTLHIAEEAREHGVRRFVNISTDKAVNPASIMGATKRVAEFVVEHVGQQAGPGQMFVSVRFGNVLGSRGSVLPIFEEQIQQGGPLTITHPDMRRYFMTIPEAAQLVLQAGAIGENGQVYVLDMGDPIRIVDLARDLIRLHGLRPEHDIELVYSGMRPGEKLFEELLTAEEGIDASKHTHIFVARKQPIESKLLANRLDELFRVAQRRDTRGIRSLLAMLIPVHELYGRGGDTPPPGDQIVPASVQVSRSAASSAETAQPSVTNPS